MGAFHDDYKQLPLPTGMQLARCPVCGSAAELWQYSVSDTAPTTKVVCCANGDPIVPEDVVLGTACPLYLPPLAFYSATAREAARFWNEYADALATQRAERIVQCVNAHDDLVTNLVTTLRVLRTARNLCEADRLRIDSAIVKATGTA